jgi:L-threonylcarbamoyladenylate synthase
VGSIIARESDKAAQVLATHLATGALAIMPCDTIYGIVGAVGDSEQALRHVKGRPDDKPFIQLVTFDMVGTIAGQAIDPAVLALWPGPLTVIVRDVSGGRTAIRVPADPFLLEVLRLLGKPLYSTSVNVSGEPSLERFDEMYMRFTDAVPLFVKGKEQQGNVPSTIIDICAKPYALVRQGVMDVTALLRVT